jgi:ribosomal protein L32
VPERFFHVEFYDNINTGSSKREYRYVWPGDIAADRVSVHVQQPATATDFAITPAFSESMTGNDTLLYWVKEIGAAPAGKALPITLRYNKSDARTSKKILGVVTPVAASAPGAPEIDVDAVKPADTAPRGSSDAREDWILVAFLVLLAAVTAGILWFKWRRERREHAPAEATYDARFCSKCGNALRSDDRFCSKCGKEVPAGNA